MESLLIERAKEGDSSAFLDLIANYDRQIMRVVYRFSGNLYDREDLYQEVFLACFKSIAKFRGDCSFATWLHRVALNRCIDYMKKAQPVVESRDEDTAIGEDHERRRKLQTVRKAMNKLKGPQQICFFLYYIEDWSQEDISQLLGCRTGTVKSHLNRARDKVKRDREVLLWQTS